MLNLILILTGKLLSFISVYLNLGNGSTWPGHIALNINPDFAGEILKKSKTKIILITGTNGKTTTAKILESILEKDGKRVLTNKSGANLLNGIASSLIMEAGANGKVNKDYAIFETDESALSEVASRLTPDFLIALDLFRDQLDRYGEVDTIYKNWKSIYSDLKGKTKFILNGDDPRIAYLGMETDVDAKYFGLDEPAFKTNIPQYAADSSICPRCSHTLEFKPLYFSHIGVWECPSCGLKRPRISLNKSPSYPLEGIYNIYNTLASVLTAQELGVEKEAIEKGLIDFKPAFGRQEELNIDNRKVKLFLSKNPTGFNESLRTINSLKAGYLLIVLNDRIPDGRDISWIWDIDFENLLKTKTTINLAGDRVYDMALRLKYAGLKTLNFEDLDEAINNVLEKVSEGETLYILPTYSAMLEVRKILTGKKIL